MSVPQTTIDIKDDSFEQRKKRRGYSGTKLEHIARARNGFRYNRKSHLGNLKSDLRGLLGGKYKEGYEKAENKIDKIQEELFELVDEAWISKRKEIINDE